MGTKQPIQDDTAAGATAVVGDAAGAGAAASENAAAFEAKEREIREREKALRAHEEALLAREIRPSQSAQKHWSVKNDCFAKGILYHAGDTVSGGDFSDNPNFVSLS